MANPLQPILWVPGKVANAADDIAMLGETGVGFRRLMNMIPGMSDRAVSVASRLDSPYVNPFSAADNAAEELSRSAWTRNQERVMDISKKLRRRNEVDYAADEAGLQMVKRYPALSQAAADAAQAEVLSDYLLANDPELYRALTNSMNTGRMVDRLGRRLNPVSDERFDTILRSLGMLNKVSGPGDVRAARAIASGSPDLEGLTAANLEFSMIPETTLNSSPELILLEAYRRAANPERYIIR